MSLLILTDEMVNVPLIGRSNLRTSSGTQQNTENYFPIPMEFMPNNQTFMLTVCGESMVNAGILNGDMVLVEQQQTADNGDMVVAIDRMMVQP